MKRKPHILIIDDDHFFCMAVEEMLSKHDYQVKTASNGQRALKILNANPDQFDVIILDKMLQGLSGFDLLKKLSLIPIIRSLPVILLTAHLENEKSKKILEYSLSSILQKPVEEVVLVKAVKRALKEKPERII